MFIWNDATPNESLNGSVMDRRPKTNKKDCVLNICSHNWDINDRNYKWGY